MKNPLLVLIWGCAAFATLPLETKADERIAELKVDLGDDFTDGKLNDALISFAEDNRDTPILVLVAVGTTGKAAVFKKCVYDREKKILLLLNRTVYQTIPSPTTSHSWVVWRDVEFADLSEGIPWFNERLKPENSKITDDGRTSLPIRYPSEPAITTWP